MEYSRRGLLEVITAGAVTGLSQPQRQEVKCE